MDRLTKKIINIGLIFIFIFVYLINPYLFASEIPGFLCEIGLKFYQQGRYEEALTEFKKALLVQPNYEPALKYIQLIEQTKIKKDTAASQITHSLDKSFIPYGRTGLIKETLDYIERERISGGAALIIEEKGKKEESPSPVGLTIRLDESLNQLKQPFEIKQGESVIIIGKNIQRFLATHPDILTIDKKSNDELLVSGKEIGYTYLHIWDDNGRWTTEWLGVFPLPKGPTYEELIRKEEEKRNNFKLRYSLDWYTYEVGRKVDELERNYYSWSHNLSLNGPTPYGNLDSSLYIRRAKLTTDLTYFTLGLTDGQFGAFKNFSLRGFDFSPAFNNFSFPGATLRGVMLNADAFGDKLDYTVFWGREGGGRYGNLSPGLNKIKNSFLEGMNLNYSPSQKQNYRFSLLHGHGRDRLDYLNRYGYDFSSNWNFERWGLGYEIAQDSENFASLYTWRFHKSNLNLNLELRDISKKFLSITGNGWRQGEQGALFNLNYTPTDKLNMNGNLNIYRDRLYPAEDNDNRLNEDFDWTFNYQASPSTFLSLRYSLQNELGRAYQYRYQNVGLNLSHTFRFIRDIHTYFNYYHQENKNFVSSSSDYINDRLYSGIRFNLFGGWYYYLNKEINFLESRYYGIKGTPHALETGLDWAQQIGTTPFYGNLRFSFRDEEKTEMPISFLGGEDYIEGYSELSYRPSGKDLEIYGSTRFRNIWADNPNVSKYMEFAFNAGMRYLWDTGLRWEAVGDVEGYVFKDLNSDGLRQRNEPPVAGIKIWLGKNKSQTTDIFGYYKFKGVKGHKVYLTLDTNTLPLGFVLTVPVNQEIVISHHRSVKVDFGIISRTEISGFVFEDVDRDGEYGPNDKVASRAVIILDDGKRALTDETGKYVFTNVCAGEHTITLDINSLPVYYLPTVAISQKITITEGTTSHYNIPLKKIKQSKD